MEAGPSETRASSSPSHPIGPGGYAPGTILADRYRIVALAGRGGMGVADGHVGPKDARPERDGRKSRSLE